MPLLAAAWTSWKKLVGTVLRGASWTLFTILYVLAVLPIRCLGLVRRDRSAGRTRWSALGPLTGSLEAARDQF